MAMTSRERLTTPQQWQQDSDLSIKGHYRTPLERPLWRVQIFPGIVAYDDMVPLVATDGAPIAATAPGTWGQLYAAGRP